MLIMNDRQLDAFAAAGQGAFKQELAEHLREHFGWHARAWGPQTTQAVVEHGFARAQAHGFETRRDVCLYVTLLPLLGGWFDEDPMLAFAGAYLQARGPRTLFSHVLPVVLVPELVIRLPPQHQLSVPNMT